MKYLNTTKFSAIMVVAILALPQYVSAVLLNNPAPGAGATMQDFIYLLIEIMQLIGIPVLTVAIIYSGFLIVTAGGNEEQVTKGKKYVLWTLVGATIILGASVIADFIYGTASAF